MDDLESQKKDAIGREDYVEANALKQEIEKLQAASQDLFLANTATILFP